MKIKYSNKSIITVQDIVHHPVDFEDYIPHEPIQCHGIFYWDICLETWTRRRR